MDLSSLEFPLMLLGITCISTMSLQLILGGAGLLSLGHAAFFAVGGYASGALSIYLTTHFGITSAPLLLLTALVSSALAAALAGLIVAIPCLRLQGDYLAITTLGFGEIISNMFKNIDAVGGATGLTEIPKLTNLPAIWIVVVLIYVLLRRLYGSALGYAIQATRDDEIAARSIGISTSRAKLAAFVVGSGLAGIAGSFYAHMQQIIVPDDAAFLRSVEIVLVVVIGGMYRLSGSLIGAVVFVFVPYILRFGPDKVAQNTGLFFSVIVIVLMIFNPRGLTALGARLNPLKFAKAETHGGRKSS